MEAIGNTRAPKEAERRSSLLLLLASSTHLSLQRQSAAGLETSIVETHTGVLYRLHVDGSLGSRSTILPYQVDEVLGRVRKPGSFLLYLRLKGGRFRMGYHTSVYADFAIADTVLQRSTK